VAITAEGTLGFLGKILDFMILSEEEVCDFITANRMANLKEKVEKELYESLAHEAIHWRDKFPLEWIYLEEKYGGK
jgi:hypothetical protein